MRKGFPHRNRHGHRPPAAKPAPNRGWPIERLEPRRLMSSDSVSYLAEDPTVTAITWHDQETYAKKGEWLAQFDDVNGTPAEQISAIQGRVAGTGLELAVADHLGSDGLVLLQAPAEVDFASLNPALAAAPGFRFVEPNLVDIQTPGLADPAFPDDSFFGFQWSLHNTGQAILGQTGVPDADIDMPEAWDLVAGATGRGSDGLPDWGNDLGDVVVAVIDSGVGYFHRDLAPNMWRNLPELNGVAGVDDDHNGFVDDVHGYDFVGAGDSNPIDDHNHGTHVAGTIAAVGNNGQGVAGINGGAKIMALKFLTPNTMGGTSGTYADAIEAFNYVTMMRQRGVNIRVTNNSWGGTGFSAALRNAIAANADAGVLCVAAAHNQARDNDLVPMYPASFDLPNIISVAATDNRDNKPQFSNWGATSVDLGAPGHFVLSTITGSRYAYFNGTSMAAPHVAGVASLGWSLRPRATAEQVRDAIFAGVDKVPSMQGATPTVTGGRLNAYNTLRLLTPRDALSDLAGALRDVVSSNPGTPLAEKVGSAVAKLDAALDEFHTTPPDLRAVAGNIKGALADLEVAVTHGLLPAAQGVSLMDELTSVSRRIADEALTTALALARPDNADFTIFNDFESAGGASSWGFRLPNFSGSTAANVGGAAATPNIQRATATFPAGNPFAGSRVGETQFRFAGTELTRWLRHTTFNTNGPANPAIDLSKPLNFDVYSTVPVSISLLVRETGGSGPIGANGGSTGTIEFVGATAFAGPGGASAGPVGRTIPANTWTTLTFNIPNEPVAGFTGDGQLTGDWGVLEALAITSTGEPGPVRIFYDNFSQGVIPEPAVVPSKITRAQSLLAEGDSLRAAGYFKDAAGMYSRALSQALSAADNEDDDEEEEEEDVL